MQIESLNIDHRCQHIMNPTWGRVSSLSLAVFSFCTLAEIWRFISLGLRLFYISDFEFAQSLESCISLSVLPSYFLVIVVVLVQIGFHSAEVMLRQGPTSDDPLQMVPDMYGIPSHGGLASSSWTDMRSGCRHIGDCSSATTSQRMCSPFAQCWAEVALSTWQVEKNRI